ncbi:hypothetical protein ASPTUDRAFT_755250 [Aspergillus tubingensis CBS 134.48]|uniref:Uncharacterized protein n=1 Tax=Aspergillus tubingensis (strain CBS 134.48) TaxID=767770 RepID=A0A1L9MYK7_ASPTC|nr:hypothetical protein ASPTUDRAFT_755250 [Aspergillus tubingensis CBS 134.48]
MAFPLLLPYSRITPGVIVRLAVFPGSPSSAIHSIHRGIGERRTVGMVTQRSNWPCVKEGKGRAMIDKHWAGALVNFSLQQTIRLRENQINKRNKRGGCQVDRSRILLRLVNLYFTTTSCSYSSGTVTVPLSPSS